MGRRLVAVWAPIRADTMFRRRKRLLRLHIEGRDESIEGIFLGFEAGHYRLANARLLETADRSIPLGEAWVPRERVLHCQVVG